MKNPLYIEYYSHEGCDCYKIDLPWSTYRRDTKVLCKVEDGIDCARTMATGILLRHLAEALAEKGEEIQLKTQNYGLPLLGGK